LNAPKVTAFRGADVFDETPEVPVFDADAREDAVRRLSCVVPALINEKKMRQAIILNPR